MQLVTQIRRKTLRESRADKNQSALRQHDAEHAPRCTERDDLHEIRRGKSASRRADALEDGDCFLLLLDEDARDRRDADAAEYEYDEARQRKVILSARELLAQILFRVLVRAHVVDVVTEFCAES